MKKIVVLPGLVFLPFVFPAFAVDGVNSGASMTTGAVPSHYSLAAAARNPAMAPLIVPEDERWRLSYLPSISASYEIGNVENFADDLEELIDIIDDPSLVEDLESTRIRFNDVLVRMGQEGYIKNSVNVSIPVSPVYFDSGTLGGTIYMDVNYGAQVSLRVLDSPLTVNQTAQTLETDTSIYIKSGIETKISVGYGREVLEINDGFFGAGRLYAGAKVSLIELELSKQVTRIEDLNGEEVSDVIRDEYDNNLESNTNIGIDVGLLWDAGNYRVGLLLDNINSPSFDYGPVGENCEARTQGSVERSSCDYSEQLVADGRLDGRESHTKHALLRVNGLYKLSDRWHISGALDLAEYDDIVGDENQWFNVAMSYEAKSRYIPSPRIGYQSNLAGSEITSYTFGFTWLKCLSLDVEMSTDSVEIDGESAPRRAGLSLAFEESF